ncbi:sulfotransferase 6B1-like [Pangshura tecta]
MTIARKKFIERLDQAMATAEKMVPEDLLCSYKGVLHPVIHCSAETFKALESFEARSDDVLLVGYPKTVSWGSYFDHIIERNKHFDDENIMFITYEELKENPNLGVKKTAEFFGFSVTDEESQAVADRSSFQAMKENSHKTHGALGNVLFRKGEFPKIVSDWKNLFTEAQNQEMEKKFEESLAGTKLGAKMKYGVYCKA